MYDENKTKWKSMKMSENYQVPILRVWTKSNIPYQSTSLPSSFKDDKKTKISFASPNSINVYFRYNINDNITFSINFHPPSPKPTYILWSLSSGTITHINETIQGNIMSPKSTPVYYKWLNKSNAYFFNMKRTYSTCS